MNIFQPWFDAKKSAMFLDDSRLGCQIKEGAQILSTTVQVLCKEHKDKVPDGIYKMYNPNGRFVKWVLESKNNFTWLFNYIHFMNSEYLKRFGKSHKSYHTALNCLNYDFRSYLPLKGITPFAMCKRSEQLQKEQGLTIYQAYRKVLIEKWTKEFNSERPPKWTNSPGWEM